MEAQLLELLFHIWQFMSASSHTRHVWQKHTLYYQANLSFTLHWY